ncbi:UDP-N-acetylenolpyruvoylglucosamine reductase, partial [Candidatus Kaiserbacteria bacterium CG10_big_fil_rev_8_21_14_0_10_45_20]
SLSAIREAVLQIRATKFPDLHIYGTAGSFFTNPIVSKKEAERILALFPEAVHFPEGEEVKFSLAWLLDNVLHVKGMREGGAMVWHAQPLVLVAEKNATAKEVHALAKKIIALVKENVGIEIVPEVFIL